MNVIIPLGGLGKRFLDAGYDLPKPLISLFLKPIIFWLLDNLTLQPNDKVFIICNKSLEKYRFDALIKKKYPNFNIIYLKNDTRGAAETIYLGTKNIRNNKETILLDGDTFYNIDLLNLYRKQENKNLIVSFKQSDTNPVYSYIELDKNKSVLRIAEKERISNLANTGAYAFSKLNELKRYCKLIIDNNLKFGDEFYMSRVISEMINDGSNFSSIILSESDFDVVGTPFQYKLFQNKFLSSQKTSDYFEKYRICFDFDNTLVSYPIIPADYTSVEPIQQNIDFLKFLKELGCTIIIYTARRMKTHNGNVGKITADVGKITIETLENFEIPYDELYFGKPYAHAYIDDLAVNAFDDLEKVMGVSSFKIEERDFNSVNSNTLEVITKRSSQTNKLKGEIMWYQNLPMKFSEYVPKVISHNENFSEYTMEKIEGITFQELFLSNNLKDDVFLMLLNILKNLHSHNDCNTETSNLIYANYAEKLRDRNKKYDFSKFDNHKKVFHSITKNLKDYETNGNGVCGLIHGDVVFTNIIVDKFGKLKLIDPRGLLGNTVTNNGDIMYDYAKILQSLIGYDEVMQMKVVNDDYRKRLIVLLFDFISTNYDLKYINYIKTITKSLLYSLIPLHDNDKCFGYYQLISKLDEI